MWNVTVEALTCFYGFFISSIAEMFSAEENFSRKKGNESWQWEQ
jgi:hypothetical protein